VLRARRAVHPLVCATCSAHLHDRTPRPPQACFLKILYLSQSRKIGDNAQFLLFVSRVRSAGGALMEDGPNRSHNMRVPPVLHGTLPERRECPSLLSACALLVYVRDGRFIRPLVRLVRRIFAVGHPAHRRPAPDRYLFHPSLLTGWAVANYVFHVPSVPRVRSAGGALMEDAPNRSHNMRVPPVLRGTLPERGESPILSICLCLPCSGARRAVHPLVCATCSAHLHDRTPRPPQACFLKILCLSQSRIIGDTRQFFRRTAFSQYG